MTTTIVASLFVLTILITGITWLIAMLSFKKENGHIIATKIRFFQTCLWSAFTALCLCMSNKLNLEIKFVALFVILLIVLWTDSVTKEEIKTKDE